MKRETFTKSLFDIAMKNRVCKVKKKKRKKKKAIEKKLYFQVLY
jgi:hypothetical protein